MKVVVTGASGNVGTAVLRLLGGESGWHLTGVARRRPGTGADPYRHATWVTVDLGDDTAPELLAGPLADADAVVHLAWAIHPSRDDPPMWRTNVTGTRHLLQAVARARVPRLVVASSVAAYTPAPRWSRVSEGWPRDGVPDSAYSRGKVWLERVLDDFGAKHPATVTRLRPCAILQPEAAGEFTRWLVGTLVPGRLVGSSLLPLPFWRGLRAQAVHAEDVAGAIRAALTRGAEGAFNLAAEPVLTAGDLASVLGGVRVPVPRTVVSSGARLAWRTGMSPLHPGWVAMADRAALVDTTRARTDLDWRPRYDAWQTLSGLVSGIRCGAGARGDPLAPSAPAGLSARLRAVPWGRPTRQSQD